MVVRCTSTIIQRFTRLTSSTTSQSQQVTNKKIINDNIGHHQNVNEHGWHTAGGYVIQPLITASCYPLPGSRDTVRRVITSTSNCNEQGMISTFDHQVYCCSHRNCQQKSEELFFDELSRGNLRQSDHINFPPISSSSPAVCLYPAQKDCHFIDLDFYGDSTIYTITLDR